jgi:hypothetical protein
MKCSINSTRENGVSTSSFVKLLEYFLLQNSCSDPLDGVRDQSRVEEANDQ